eukprot:GFUD01014646.1.p1 GENE.GFUD01014646.1~~GFUD01014646.1.p1  ORF type:complete len:336 (-),score=55.96 GFUD01014646.1:73-1080(-)
MKLKAQLWDQWRNSRPRLLGVREIKTRMLTPTNCAFDDNVFVVSNEVVGCVNVYNNPAFSARYLNTLHFQFKLKLQCFDVDDPDEFTVETSFDVTTHWFQHTKVSVGKKVIAGCGVKTAVIWNKTTGREEYRKKQKENESMFTFCKVIDVKNEYLAIFECLMGELIIFGRMNNEWIMRHKCQTLPDFLPSCHEFVLVFPLIFVIGDDGFPGLKVWNIQTGQLVIHLLTQMRAVSISANYQYLVVTCITEGKRCVIIFDLQQILDTSFTKENPVEYSRKFCFGPEMQSCLANTCGLLVVYPHKAEYQDLWLAVCTETKEQDGAASKEHDRQTCGIQ